MHTIQTPGELLADRESVPWPPEASYPPTVPPDVLRPSQLCIPSASPPTHANRICYTGVLLSTPPLPVSLGNRIVRMPRIVLLIEALTAIPFRL
jgi:hypothetical protein